MNKDTKRENKRNQFMIVSGLSYNQDDDEYVHDKYLTRREITTTILLSRHEFSLSPVTGNGNYEALNLIHLCRSEIDVKFLFTLFRK